MNPVDMDRLNAKTTNGNIVDLAAYREAAARAEMLNGSISYTDPKTVVAASLGAVLFVVMLVLFLLSRRG